MLATSNEQGEVLYRWVMGLWSVLHLVRIAFPDVLLESCSGGGGRFDLSFHYFSHQIWTSDNTDAHSRAKIQYGTSLAYPANSMAAHVSATPNHQVHRQPSIWSRHAVAMGGLLGYELNLSQLSERDRSTIRAIVPYYKQNIEPLVLTGDLYRLSSPFAVVEDNENSPVTAIWSYVAADKKSAVVYCILTSFYEVVIRPARVTLMGLLPNARYAIEQLAENPDNQAPISFQITHHPGSLHGQTLMSAGLVVRFNRDHDGVIFLLKTIEV